MPTLIWIALGGALGASARYLIGTQTLRLMGGGFPWGTLCVNVLGSFLMGMLISALALKFSLSQEVRHFLTTGILGGFTTFSAFSLDFAILTERKAHLLAWSYLGASVAFSILALFAGLWLMRVVLQ
ncbi:MAG: fluoride efflux transporter CrcB [Hyphomicrobiales bacterium]